MLLENMTFVEVEEYLRHQDTVLIPVGSVEQHSSYGIIGTDFVAAEGVARIAGDKLGLLVAPTLNYGVSPHHMAFKGSVTLSPATFIQMINDVSLSFLHHGFSRIIYINGHGGNKNSIETSFQDLKMRGIKGQFVLISWFDGLRETELIAELFNNEDGKHATPSEISLTMFLRPELFNPKSHEHKAVEKKRYIWPLTAKEMKETFPDGSMESAPWLASVDKGRQVLNEAVESVVNKIEHIRSLPLQ